MVVRGYLRCATRATMKWSVLTMLFTLAASSVLAQTCIDYDGNSYATQQIADRLWMMESLRTTHYANGDQVPEITGDLEWSQTAEGACCSQQNDLGFDTVYGKLYNHHAASDERNLCPVGLLLAGP